MASRLQGFVKRDGPRDEERNPTPSPSAQSQQPHQSRSARADRSAAQQLKVRRSEKPTVNPQTFGQQLAGTAPLSGYNSNSNHTAGRNIFPIPQYEQFDIPQAPVGGTGPGPQFIQQHEQHVPMQGGAFDDTLTSGLEDTKSDVQYDGDPRGMDDYGGGPADENGYSRQDEEVHDQYINQNTRHLVRNHGRSSTHATQHVLQHKQSQSPLVEAGAEQQPNPYLGQPTHGISGRFQVPTAPAGERWQQDIAHRGSPVSGRQAAHSNKRGYSNEPGYENDERAAYNRQRGMDQEELEDSEDEGSDGEEPPEQEEGLSEERKDGNRHHQEHEGEHHGFDPRSEGAESAVSAVSRRQARRDEVDKALRAKDEAEDRFKLDHADEELERMTYDDLKKETWDGEKPGGQKRDNPTQTQETDFTPEEYFIHMVQEGTAEAQTKFFEDMSLAEYEEAGDFFIEKFAGLMKQIKDARKKKRDLVTEFENEIEGREKAVRDKSEILERKFNDMRAGGEGVLKGKG